jgi:type I restriction enzyme, S subunit
LAIVDCEHKTAPEDLSGNYFAVGTPAMRSNVINYEEARRISRKTFDAWTRRMTPRYGDILFAREAPVGPVVMIPKEENIAPGQRTVLLRPNPEFLDSRFLYYLISSPQQQRRIESLAAGSTVAHLNVADVRALALQVPELKTQRAIAEVLGALDDKIAANTEIANKAEVLALLKYSAATASIDLVPMSQKLSPVLGGTPARSRDDYWGGDERWISAKDVTGAFGQIILDTDEKITVLATEKTKAKPLPKGSVIMTARGTVGAVARLGEPASFNQSCYGFVPGDIPASILYFVVHTAADHAKSMAHGSVFDTITKKTFDHLLMPDLTAPEADALDAVLTPLLAVIESSARENLALVQVRENLLPALMSGKLRVKDVEKVVEGAV